MGRPLKYKTVKELEDAILKYFESRTHKGKKYRAPTISGLALYLGFESRQSLYDYNERPEFSYTIKRAILAIEEYAEEVLLSGEVATGAIFWLKNHKWTDKTVQDVNVTGYSLFETATEEKAKKYDNNTIKRGQKDVENKPCSVSRRGAGE